MQGSRPTHARRVTSRMTERTTPDVDVEDVDSDEPTWLTIGRHSVRLVIFAVVIFLIIHFAFPHSPACAARSS